MLELRAGDIRAAISPEAGGRLASLVVGGRELLVGPGGPDARPIAWGCYLMAPWAGRLEHGRFPWHGRTVQLPRTHGRNAIHGLVWNRPWTVEHVSGSQATLACGMPPEWPMGGVVRQSFELTAAGLRMTAAITAAEAMPVSVGWHPWFARRDGSVAVRVDADAVLATERMIPTGLEVPVSGPLDLRAGPRLGARRLDHAYVDAASPAVIEWPDLRLELRFEPTPGVVVVHTPPAGVCVEPQTAPPNALVLGPRTARTTGVRHLDRGEAFEATFEIAWA